MSFNGHFEKSPTKSSFKWPVLIIDNGECWHSTWVNFGSFIVFYMYITLTFIVFYIPKKFTTWFTVWMIYDLQSLNGQYNRKWILNLILATSSRVTISRKISSKPYPSLHFNMFTAKGFSETSPVMHLSKHIFQSQ